MERGRSAVNGPDVEEIPNVSTLSLAQLEAILADQEAESRKELDKAFTGIRQAARYRKAAVKCEDNSRAARSRYEDAEIVINELRKIIVERNKQIIDGQVEPHQARASEKRRRVSGSNHRSRVYTLELTADASHQALLQTCHGNEWHRRQTKLLRQ